MVMLLLLLLLMMMMMIMTLPLPLMIVSAMSRSAVSASDRTTENHIDAAEQKPPEQLLSFYKPKPLLFFTASCSSSARLDASLNSVSAANANHFQSDFHLCSHTTHEQGCNAAGG
jgi:hypothetical protein